MKLKVADEVIIAQGCFFTNLKPRRKFGSRWGFAINNADRDRFSISKHAHLLQIYLLFSTCSNIKNVIVYMCYNTNNDK